MNPFTPIDSRAVVLPANDIDTDQIIPARYLKVTDKLGLGANLFADWRYAPDGAPKPDFVLNQARSQGCQVFVAGDNFGCGSSREHAPWALLGFGFRAVVATSFADIFRNNSLKNGLLPIQVSPQTHRALLEQLEADPEAHLLVDLDEQVLVLPDGQAVNFPIDSFSRTCLLKGVDELGYLLDMEALIGEYERSHSAHA
jgi:3-isopropylmalate/(R)-2-methylmalate dehydratase small subunit